jgi:hypothetical protein
MARLEELDTETRTRIASLLYKLAIRVMKVSKRPLDPSRAVLALDHAQGNRVRKLIQYFSAEGQKKAPDVQKVLATRTVAPGQGDGIRVDLLFGPVRLLEQSGDLGAVNSKTKLSPGQPPQGLVPLEKLQDALISVFGGALPQVKLITEDVRDLSDRPFRIEHAYDKDLGARAWRVVHNGGPKDGQVTFYENPNILSQLEKNPDADLDPYRPAVFRSAEEASLVLNQLTRGTSVSSRNFPKFREYTVYFKYSAVYLQSEGTLFMVFDRLLSEADADAEEKSKLSFQEKKDLVEKAVAWLKEKEVSPDALLSTLQAKDPELAKKYKEVLPDVIERLQEVA